MNLPANLPHLLREAGLRVEVDPGWLGRGHFDFAPPGALNHHTGASAKLWSRAKRTEYARWMFRVGRSDLPAPICNLALGPDGTVYIGASRASYHGGTAKASGTVGSGNANSLYIGIEWMLSGTEKIPAAMMAAGVTLNAVLTEKVTAGGKGTSVGTISAHYQTSATGKWDIGDPDGIPYKGVKVIDMDKFRAAVKAERNRLYHGGTLPLPGFLDVDWATINAKPHWAFPGRRAVQMTRAADEAGATIICWQELSIGAVRAINKMPGWHCYTGAANDILPRRGPVYNAVAVKTGPWKQIGKVRNRATTIQYRKGTKRGGMRGPVLTKVVNSPRVLVQHEVYGFVLTVTSDHVQTAYSAVGDSRAKHVKSQRARIATWVQRNIPFLFGEDGNGTYPNAAGSHRQSPNDPPFNPDLGIANNIPARKARSLGFNRGKHKKSDHGGVLMRSRFTRKQMRNTIKKGK